MLRFSRASRQPSPIILGDRARDARRWDAALRHYRTALARNPRNPAIWVQYGHALKEAGSYAAGEAAYRRAIADDPGVADTYLQLGHVLKLQDRTEEAKAAYLRALSIDRSLDVAGGELAALGVSVGDLPQLLRDIPAPVAADRTNGLAAGSRRKRRREGTITRADRARDLGQLDIAASLYRRTLARNPANPPIWIQYGHVLKESGQLREAELAYRQAVAFGPRLPDAHLELGRVLKLRGETEAAQRAFLRAFALDPSLPQTVSELSGLGWAAQQRAELTGFVFPDLLTPPQAEVPQHRILELPNALGQAEQQAHQYVVPVDDTSVLPPSFRQFRILFVSGAPDIPSHQYRVENYIDALALNGIDARWISVVDCDRSIDDLRAVSLVVFWRVAYVPAVSRFIRAAERLRIPTIFDVDDYVFEPRVATEKNVDGIRFLRDDEIPQFYEGVRGYRTMLLACQFATFTTKFLVERGNELGRCSFLLPNGLDSNYMSAQPGERESDATCVVIGYTPGTRTHQKDVCVAARAIARVLSENPGAIFRIVGAFDVSEIDEWKDVRAQIEHDPKVGREHVRLTTAQFDINIAPLEPDNPFTEAKSELKYFEAACLGVPTVAAASAVYRDAIRQGQTGFVASTEEEWYRALTGLVHDASLRRRIGIAARKHVLSVYSLDKIGAVARQVYSTIIKSYRAGIGRTDSALTITMILGDPIRGSGGYANVFSLVRGLWDRGHDVALYFTGSFGEFGTAEAVRKEFGVPAEVAIMEGNQTFAACDVAIATLWKTAYLLAEQGQCAKTKVYFMQDYEPLFYPMSDDYILAQGSYQLGLRNVSFGPWVRDRIKRDLGVDADAIPYFIDKSIFYFDPSTHRATDRLIVFARPEMARRLWDLTAAALKLFIEQTGFAGSIEFFGSSTEAEVPFPCRRYGVISLSEMAKLFREGTLGVAMSPTNPSAVPYQMMACGLPVVNVDYANNEISYGGRDSIFLAAPARQSLADAIGRAMSDADCRVRVADNARNFITRMPDPGEAVEQFELLLRGYLGEGCRIGDRPAAT